MVAYRRMDVGRGIGNRLIRCLNGGGLGGDVTLGEGGLLGMLLWGEGLWVHQEAVRRVSW